MHKYLLGTLAVAAVALTASIPAFSAAGGTLNVTITAQAPAAPCLAVTPGSLDFGTLPFSANNGAGLSQGNRDVSIANCGTVGQNLLGSSSNATGTSGSWTPLAYEPTFTISPCPAVNGFYLDLFGFNTPSLVMTGTPAPVLASGGGSPAVFPVGSKDFRLTLTMPCQGSNGAGETKTLTATFTAVVA